MRRSYLAVIYAILACGQQLYAGTYEYLESLAPDMRMEKISSPAPASEKQGASLIPAEISAGFRESGIEISEEDFNRINEVYNHWSYKGTEIWPEVSLAETPVMFVFSGKENALVNHPSPPENCLPVAKGFPAAQFCHMPDRTFMSAGAACGRINGIYTAQINTLKSWDDYFQTHALNYTKDYLDYMAMTTHEMFHAFQYREKKFAPHYDGIAPRLTKIDYPDTDLEINLLNTLEGRILSDILDSGSKTEIESLWQDFIAVRSTRHKLLNSPDLILLENYMEFTEGTAQYVTFKTQYGEQSGVSPLPDTLKDPKFKGYNTAAVDRRKLKEELRGLYRRTSYMGYVYFTGAALCSGLDNTFPGWKSGFFRKYNGLDKSLYDLLTKNITAPQNMTARIDRIKIRYDSDTIMREISGRLNPVNEKSRKRIEEYKVQPGKRYRFVFPGAQRADLMPHAPVLLTTYGDERIFEGGMIKLSRIDSEFNELATISFNKPLPILFDMGKLFFEIVIPDSWFSVPLIAADVITPEGGAANYTGHASFNNGIFAWTGERLVVKDDGNTIVLTFPN